MMIELLQDFERHGGDVRASQGGLQYMLRMTHRRGDDLRLAAIVLVNGLNLPDQLHAIMTNGIQAANEWADVGGSYDVMICLFDSIGYVVSNSGLLRVFQGVHRNLRPKGLFIFEFWHAAAMLTSYSPLRVRKLAVTEGEIL